MHPRQVVVTKGGDEETGAARVTADEWILQDMRCQQVHAFCHVCYACTCALHVCVCVPRAWVPAMRRQCATCPEACMHACAPRQAAVSERIEVVTADKELRRAASGVHKNVKLINPVKWCAARALVVHCSCTPQRPAFAMGTSCRWRRYLPRLKGLKSDYSNAPATDDE